MKRLITPILLFALTLYPAAQGKPIMTLLDIRVRGISAQEMKGIIGYLSIVLIKTRKHIVIEMT